MYWMFKSSLHIQHFLESPTDFSDEQRGYGTECFNETEQMKLTKLTFRSVPVPSVFVFHSVEIKWLRKGRFDFQQRGERM